MANRNARRAAARIAARERLAEQVAHRAGRIVSGHLACATDADIQAIHADVRDAAQGMRPSAKRDTARRANALVTGQGNAAMVDADTRRAWRGEDGVSRFRDGEDRIPKRALDAVERAGLRIALDPREQDRRAVAPECDPRPRPIPADATVRAPEQGRNERVAMLIAEQRREARAARRR
jgi:hypothetical protein